MLILIDGHNLIGQMRDIRLDDPHDEEKLLARLRKYQGRSGKQLVVFFDPGLDFQLPQHQSLGNITVRRAGTGQTADDLITLEVARSPNVRELVVVTSDRDLRQTVEAYGARVMDAQTFAVEMKNPNRRRKPPRPTRHPHVGPGLPKDEIEEWLAVFGCDG